MESANIGKYNDVNMFLISEGGQYFISFGNPDIPKYNSIFTRIASLLQMKHLIRRGFHGKTQTLIINRKTK